MKTVKQQSFVKITKKMKLYFVETFELYSDGESLNGNKEITVFKIHNDNLEYLCILHKRSDDNSIDEIKDFCIENNIKFTEIIKVN